MHTPIDHLTRRWFLRAGFTTRHVATSRGPAHVLEGEGGGDLPPLVLLHGLASRSSHYAGVVRYLRRRHRRILPPDLPGHGHSYRPKDAMFGWEVVGTLVETLDAALDEPAVFFGNSLGAYAAIKYANHYPDRVLGMLLNSPGGGGQGVEALMGYLERFKLDSHTDAQALIDRAFGRRLKLRSLLALGVRRQFGQPAVRGLIENMHTDDLLTRHEVANLPMPVRVLWGEREDVQTAEHLAFFRRWLPDHAVVERPANYCHAPYLDRPRDLASRIVAFAEALP